MRLLCRVFSPITILSKFFLHLRTQIMDIVCRLVKKSAKWSKNVTCRKEGCDVSSKIRGA